MKRLGFGCMRLPMIGGEVDMERFRRMTDRYMEAGFRYFDTARVYLDGRSETALREALVRRYPRDGFFLTDKLSGSQIRTSADIRPFFHSQLESLGTDYLDMYLMHAMNAEVYDRFLRLGAFDIAAELKAAGLVRHVGISFHDRPEVLERILTERPEIEAVQIQLNYADWDSPSIRSGAVYEVCRRFGKPILVMEPVKGGGLASLPPAADRRLRDLGGGSPASYAIRYAASCEGVVMVLSGMSDEAQMEDNIRTMEDFRPLDGAERAAVEDVRRILREEDAVACTGCRYCVAGCPRGILIPEIFACLNTKRRYADWGSDTYYAVSTAGHGRASDCVGCGQCERICPQHLPVRAHLARAAEMFDGAAEG